MTKERICDHRSAGSSSLLLQNACEGLSSIARTLPQRAAITFPRPDAPRRKA
jgi:hypothetical protein